MLTAFDLKEVKAMKTEKKGTIRSKIKRGDQVVFIAGREYNRYDSSGNRQQLLAKFVDYRLPS